MSGSERCHRVADSLSPLLWWPWCWHSSTGPGRSFTSRPTDRKQFDFQRLQKLQTMNNRRRARVTSGERACWLQCHCARQPQLWHRYPRPRHAVHRHRWLQQGATRHPAHQTAPSRITSLFPPSSTHTPISGAARMLTAPSSSYLDGTRYGGKTANIVSRITSGGGTSRIGQVWTVSVTSTGNLAGRYGDLAIYRFDPISGVAASGMNDPRTFIGNGNTPAPATSTGPVNCHRIRRSHTQTGPNIAR